MLAERSSPLVEKGSFEAVIWTGCAAATILFLSRVAVRMSSKGRLILNDYFLVLALPALYAGAGLLQTTLVELYLDEAITTASKSAEIAPSPGTTSRFTASMALLWISIFSVKFCFLAQFKFHKPPYAYISVRLTRYYWFCVGFCTLAFGFALAQPIILCPSSARCQYFGFPKNFPMEIALTTIDILTGCLVTSVPILLVHMANFKRLHTVINASFKGLHIFAVIVAVTRLALQYDKTTHGIRYTTIAFLLAVEATVALIMASVSSYRVLVLDYLSKRSQPDISLIGGSPRLQTFRTRWYKHGDQEQSALELSFPDIPVSGANTPSHSCSDCTSPEPLPLALSR
ncbi:hypothetical protein M011DRAFT_475069 [Sporormia fimetaria CBS 119925]|uniref:Integral membrane protein n=1 Tax=Sporormia fimetaria CBS 119925 TaxID=1340428 RepID=A0A6A6VJ38_9PLEO|nr:hypothetical protein M011DRAFT_475069 [Sporormia fimetaria CBS 119925]